MSPWINLLWLTFLLAAMAWCIATVLTPVLLGPLLRIETSPAVRARRLLLASALPWLVPMAIVLAVCVTAGAKGLGWIQDHCPHHGLGHPHLCFTHLPAIELGFIHSVAVGGVVAAAVHALWRFLMSQQRAQREVELLKTLAPSNRPLRIARTSTLLVAASGIVRPVILISRGLLDQLTWRQRRIVIAHEAAHIRHRDARRNYLFELLLLGHLPWKRPTLRAHWRQALEEQADDTVVKRFGAEHVVATLVHVARIHLRATPAGFSIVGADPVSRGRRLLRGSAGCDAPSLGPVFELAYASALLLLFVGAVTGHHAIESVLGLVTG
jgi:hypothetical protein